MNQLIKRIGQLTVPPKVNVHQLHTNAELVEQCKMMENRNPRNLELLRIAMKPAGYNLEKPGRDYWHKLVVTKLTRHVTVDIMHYKSKTPVITASTKEWAIKKQLYKLRDRSAYLNLGRVMAERCLESGIVTVTCTIDSSKCEKLQTLLTELENGGITLKEPSRYIHAAPWDQYRYQKPWEVED